MIAMPSVATAEDVDLELHIERLARMVRRARGLRTAARRAMSLARRYREEEGAGGERERACIAQALAWRAAARDARTSTHAGPSLARTSAPPAVRGTRAQNA